MPLRTANAAAAQEAEQPAAPPQRADEDSYVNPGLPLPQGVVPYSISTGIERGGQAELSGYLRSMRTQGFCCIERVIPAEELTDVRESVYEGRRRLQAVRIGNETALMSSSHGDEFIVGRARIATRPIRQLLLEDGRLDGGLTAAVCSEAVSAAAGG